MRDRMGSITEEVADIEQQQGWARLFFDIKRISAQYNFSCQVAKLQENRSKNRYRDVCPYDHSRVKLVAGTGDYINGCVVEVKDIGRRYILSQGPLPNTSGQFWQMVWEQKSKAVIMLNKIIEKGMIKCHHYWPVDSQHPLAFRDEGYRVALKSERDMENYMIREIELTNTKNDENRIVYQFHFVAWPDFDVPQSPATFLDFLACVREYGVLENEPAVIHCSAGIGRSGTFALVDTCLKYLQMGVSFDIYKTLLEMRKYRMGLVQTPQQLRFSYFAIAECERIILYKQGDEDSYSEGAPSEDYDFIYDGDDDDELVNNDLATADGKGVESETAITDNLATNESLYLSKETTKLNNNISEPLKIEPSSPEIQTQSSEPEHKRQIKSEDNVSEPLKIEPPSPEIQTQSSEPEHKRQIKSEDNEAENLDDEAILLQSRQTCSNEVVDDSEKFDSVSSENDNEMVNSSPASRVETEDAQKPKQIDQYEEIKHEEVDESEEKTPSSAPTDMKQTSKSISIASSTDEIETEHNQEKPITPLRTSSLGGDDQSEEDDFLEANGIEKTAVTSESPEKAFEKIQKNNEERTWRMYLLGGLVLSLVFSLIYSVYD